MIGCGVAGVGSVADDVDEGGGEGAGAAHSYDGVDSFDVVVGNDVGVAGGGSADVAGGSALGGSVLGSNKVCFFSRPSDMQSRGHDTNKNPTQIKNRVRRYEDHRRRH